jgi:hypothetical protein
MNSIGRYLLNTLCALVILLACALLAQAQATRTWVSGVGDDANPCSRTAPCKTFAGAYSKTAAGGEINAIDPGGYGNFGINKAITIDGAGSQSSILASGTNGINVAAGATDVVILRNININGGNTGLKGINFTSGAALHVDNCTIFDFNGSGFGFGIDFEPSAASQLFVNNTSIRNNVGGGILVKPGTSGSARISLENLQLENNLYGIRAEDNSKVTAHNTTAAGNSKNGFLAVTNGAPVEMNLERCVSKNNGTNGIAAVVAVLGGTSTIRLSYVTVTDNLTGLSAQGGTGAQIISVFQNGAGTNFISGNGTDGAATSSIGRQ